MMKILLFTLILILTACIQDEEAATTRAQYSIVVKDKASRLPLSDVLIRIGRASIDTTQFLYDSLKTNGLGEADSKIIALSTEKTRILLSKSGYERIDTLDTFSASDSIAELKLRSFNFEMVLIKSEFESKTDSLQKLLDSLKAVK